MRKIALTVLLVFLFASKGYGDEVEQGLAGAASGPVMASTRQVIAAGVESHSAIDLTRNMLHNHFTDDHVLDAHKVIIDARSMNLPVPAIVSKASEGMAKQVPPAAIVKAMEKVASRYEASYTLAGRITDQSNQKNQLGMIIAESMAAGLAGEDAEGIVRSIQQSGEKAQSTGAYALAREAFETARAAARLGVTSSVTAGLVNQALGRGFSPAELQQMRQSLVTQSRSQSPENLAKNYSAAMAQGRGFDGQGRGQSLPHGVSGSSPDPAGNGPSGGGGGADGGGSGGGSGGGPGGSGGGGGPGGPGGAGGGNK